MKNKFTETLSWIFTLLFFFAIFTSGIWLPPTVDWLKNAKPPEVEQVEQSSVEEVKIPTAEEIKQEKLLEQVKQAEGSSVLLRTEKIGDNVNPVTVRHYARWTELGDIEYWVEVIE